MSKTAAKRPRRAASNGPLAAVKQGWQRLAAWFGRLRAYYYRDTPHRSFRRTVKIKRPIQLPRQAKEAWLLVVETLLFMKKHYVFFLWMMAIYALLTYVLVGGISQLDYAALKKEASNLSNGLDVVTKSLAYFGAALSGGLSTAPTTLQQVLSGVLSLIFWLAIIWSTRMLMAGKKIKLRDAFYNSMTPLIPTILLLMLVVLQLIPAALSLFAMSVAINQYWLTDAVEWLAFGGATIAACLLTLYWLSGSLIALIVVTLPGTYPIHALADTRGLIMGRRWEMLMRIIVLLLIELLLWACVLLPAFMLDNWLNLRWLPLVPIAVQLLGGLTVIFSTVYIYKLYRSLL